MSEAKVIRKHPPTQQDFGHLDRADWEKKAEENWKGKPTHQPWRFLASC